MDKSSYMKWDKARLAERVVDLIKQRDGAIEEAERLKHRIMGLEAELNDAQEDRDNWRRDYLAMQDAHRKMRQNLFEQARLAGVLAVEGKGPFAGHADLSN